MLLEVDDKEYYAVLSNVQFSQTNSGHLTGEFRQVHLNDIDPDLRDRKASIPLPVRSQRS